jgi:hypothetical protein
VNTTPTHRALFNEDAEQATLSAMLIDARAVATARDLVVESDFYATRHRVLYRAMLTVADRGATVDPLTLAAALGPDLERAGGKDYIGFLVDAVPTADNVRYHAELIVNAAKARALADRLAEQFHAIRTGEVGAAAAAAQLQPLLDAFAAGSRAEAFPSWDDVQILDLPVVSYLVEGILPTNGACTLYGQPGVGKSFVALDLALSVASGQPFLNRAVTRSPVFYIAAEGLAGQRARVAAWKRRRGLSGRLGVRFFSEPVNLLEPGSVAKFLAAVRASGERPGLIVFDTLARCTVGGDENSARDMGIVVDNIGRIQRETGACILVVHHTRKDGESERGSNSLRGAMDAMLLVTGDDSGLSFECNKQKDGQQVDPIRLRLDPEGDSCVLVAAIHAWQSGTATMSGGERTALESLSSSFLAEGATASEWQTASGLPQRTFYRVRTLLVTRGYVNDPHGIRGGRYSLTDTGRRVVTANCQLTAA